MESPTGRRCIFKLCFFPQRYLMAFMTSIGIISAYMMRISFNVVIKYIVQPRNSTKSSTPEKNMCNFTFSHTRSSATGIYDWDPKMVNDISEAFFYGYLVGHFPGGYLSDRFGGKHVFGCSVLFCGILTLITPMIIKATEEAINVLIIRFLLGLIMGALFPSANTLISSWTPLSDRGKIVGIVYCATQFASFINNMYTMRILKLSWPYVFYIFGGIGIGWWMIWSLLCYSNPVRHPFIGNREIRYLEKELAGHVTYGKKEFPWKKILTSLGVWSFVLAQFGHTWIWHSMITDLPGYMREILKYDMKSSHSIAALPYVLMGVLTIILGFITDIFVNRKFLTLDTIRKIFTTVGAMGPGIFTLGASFSGCNRKLSLTMFCLAMGQMSFYYIGTRPLGLDLSPNYSGFIMGLVNGLGALPGVMQKYISKMITANVKTLEQWRVLFLVSLGVLAATNVFFVLFGTSKEQSWNSETSKIQVGRRKTNG